jgi:diacylglycerol kinase (ATP)
LANKHIFMSKPIKIGFIINPISGTRTKEDIPELIMNTIDLDKYEPVVRYTQHAKHAKDIALDFVQEGFPIVVSIGGDGTMNEIASSLIHTNSALAIIPCGSGNGMARHLNIPLNLRDALKLINKHKVAEIDYATANGIPFFCTCGVGFDAQIGHTFAQSEKRGFFTYFKSVLKEFFAYKPKKYKLKYGELKLKKRAFLVTFANASQYGNNAYIAPTADIQDGLIDVCILEPFRVYNMFSLAYRLFAKKIHHSNHVTTFKTKEVTIKRKKKGVFHYDGEPCKMKKKIEIKSVKQGLKVLVPINSNLQTL